MTDTLPTSETTDEPATRPLGGNFWRLWTASVVSNTGDGVSSVALPLLAESLTRDPLLFAGVAIAGRLPWLLFALQAGAIADRVDRRRLMFLSNGARFLMTALLGVAVLGDVHSIWLLYGISIGLGVAETLFDNANQAILPRVVTDKELLERANGRLFAGEITTNQFVGPPLGGFLFGFAAAVPILFDAGTFLVSAGLIFALTGTYTTSRTKKSERDVQELDPSGRAAPTTLSDADADEVAAEGRGGASPRGRSSGLWIDVREGLRWLWQHRLLRTLGILLGFLNGTAMMMMAIFALYAVGEESVLGLGPVGFSVLLTAGAFGSIAGSFASEKLIGLVGRGPALWMTLASGVVVPVMMALTSSAVVVAIAWVFFGFTSVVWNVITVSMRQTIIPDELLGRVNSVYRFLGWGSMPLGSLLGGVLAAAFGIRGPFWGAAVIMALAIVPFARVLTTDNIEAARRAA